ncbi:MAG TPA: nucleoside-diphosphate sugar epimerase/dehydratase, partial [Desulfomonilaceae bacterium]|nr:nucleoside-diphosphate sugar epimerase/dehydratase [Desulfomonilaceae bacterium]
AASFWLSYEFRFDFRIPGFFSDQRLVLLPYVALLKAILFFLLRGHVTNWRYIGLSDAPTLLLHCTICALVLALVSLMGGLFRMPRGVILIDFFMSLVLIGGGRVSIRLFREKMRLLLSGSDLNSKKPVLVMGAGDAAEMLIREIARNPEAGLKILALFDDDPSKWGQTVHGIKVMGGAEEIRRYVQDTAVDMAIVAIPTATSAQMKRIYNLLSELGVHVKTLPALHEILEDSSPLTQLRDVNISDLLGREEINIDTVQVANLIEARTVLVTGAGGSIGSELCRQILKRKPERLLLMDRSENSLFHIHRELTRRGDGPEVVPLLCDLTDESRVFYEFNRFRPELVFHAGAHKHVPMQELNTVECFKNNIGGTKILARAAHQFGTSRFLLVSTDKAVNPTSVMGASKRACEIYCQAFGRISQTIFLSVRFGNVLASEGSVIPIFLDQIKRGGPITVTHPEMRRYFMTIPEAVTLILQSMAIGKAGDVMVLEMGEPIKITDLIDHLLQLVGKDRGQIPIQYIGMRPGEKLFEEISFDSEVYEKTAHSKIRIYNQFLTDSPETLAKIERAIEAVQSRLDDREARRLLKELVPEYDCESRASKRWVAHG